MLSPVQLEQLEEHIMVLAKQIAGPGTTVTDVDTAFRILAGTLSASAEVMKALADSLRPGGAMWRESIRRLQEAEEAYDRFLSRKGGPDEAEQLEAWCGPSGSLCAAKKKGEAPYRRERPL